MKKTLAVLLALILVGAAFAQTAAPAAPAPAAPVVTYGASADIGFNVIKEKSQATYDDNFVKGTTTQVYQSGSATFAIEPWAQFDFGNGLVIKTTDGYKAGKTYLAGDAYLLKVATTYTVGGLTLYSTTAYDKNDYTDRVSGDATPRLFYMDNGFKFKQDNVSGEFSMRDGTHYVAAPAETTAFSFINDWAQNATLRQAWFQVSDIADLLTVKVGDRLASYQYIRMQGNGTNGLTSTSTVGALTSQGISGGSPINVNGTLDFNKTLKLPLVVKAFYYVPTVSTSLPEFLRTGNMFYDVGYTLDKVGTFDVGIAPSFDYTTNFPAAGFVPNLKAASYGLYTAAAAPGATVPIISSTAANQFWADANITAIPNLTLQIGVDASMNNYLDAKAFADAIAAGKLTALTAVPYSIYNLGIESTYDLKDVLKGLTVTANVYYVTGTGADYTKAEGADYVAPASATNFVSPTYTAASVAAQALGYVPSFQLNISGTYAMNEKLSFTASNNFNSAKSDYQKKWINTDLTKATYVGDLVTNWATIGGKDACGYYGTDTISLGVTSTAGKGTAGVTLGYTLYTGLPTAADLMTTATSSDATLKKVAEAKYAEFITKNFNPWSVAVSYTIAY
jgi:hypothetical protein